MSPDKACEIREAWRRDLSNGLKPEPETSDIIRGTAQAAGVPIKVLLGETRKAEIVRARHIAIYLTRRWRGSTVTALATRFKRDHSSISHALKSVQDRLDIGHAETQALLQAAMGRVTGVVSD